MSSAGNEKPSSKSSSMGSMAGCALGLEATIVDIEALIVDTPSSSSSTGGLGCRGGRMLMVWDIKSNLAVDGVTTFAVLTKSISRSQSSSSLSDGAGMGAPSGRSKSASGHSSRGKTSVGAGIVVINSGV